MHQVGLLPVTSQLLAVYPLAKTAIDPLPKDIHKAKQANKTISDPGQFSDMIFSSKNLLQNVLFFVKIEIDKVKTCISPRTQLTKIIIGNAR